MGQKFPRTKSRNYLTALIYKFSRIPFASKRTKFKLFADLTWIFDRLAQETSAKIIDKSHHPARASTLSFLKNKVLAADALIDIGCSTGELSCYLSKLCKSLIGIDYDAAKIDEAKKNCKGENVTFVCEDAFKFLEANDRRYDVLICSHVLEHLENPSKFIAKCKRFFSFIYIEVPDFDRSTLNHMRQNLSIKQNYSDDDHIHEFDRDELSQLIANHGMKVIESEFRFGVMRYWIEVGACSNPKMPVVS